jgi:hypothetical protein
MIVPVNSIAIAWMKTPRPGVHPDSSNFELVKTKRSRDEVFLDNQDQLAGTVTAVVGPDLRIEHDGKSKLVATDRVAAIAFNTELAKVSKTATPLAHVVLASGTRLTLKEAQLQDGRIVGRTAVGPTIRLLLSDIVALSIRSDRVFWLDDLPPLRYEHKPFLGTKWSAAIGKNASNGPMRLGPHVFDFGVGLHSESRITFAIPPGVERFETWVGLDADAGKQGNVRVGAWVDGSLVFGPLDIIGAKPPQRVNLTIPKNALELTLTVEFAGGGDVQDNVNWTDARFVRSLVPATGKP